MKKFVPYEKASKKVKRQIDLKKRNTWGDLNPVTKKEKNPKAYQRHPKHKHSLLEDSQKTEARNGLPLFFMNGLILPSFQMPDNFSPLGCLRRQNKPFRNIAHSLHQLTPV